MRSFNEYPYWGTCYYRIGNFWCTPHVNNVTNMIFIKFLRRVMRLKKICHTMVTLNFLNIVGQF